MRLAYSYLHVPSTARVRTDLAATAGEFHEALAYDEVALRSQEDFAAFAAEPWVAELGAALRGLLSKERSILSLGSGKGEHEVPLFLDGFDITASDLDGTALEDAGRLFPGFQVLAFDALGPPLDRRFDDILVTGLDYALDDAQLTAMLRNAAAMLEPGGRVIFVQRYRDGLAPRLLDRVLLPAYALALRVRDRLRRDGLQVVRRQHGWRRSRRELRALMQGAGFRVGRVVYACFGVELQRLPLPGPVQTAVRRADRRLHAFNSATIFELERRP
jgi:SAM-dependent methyltransferase